MQSQQQTRWEKLVEEMRSFRRMPAQVAWLGGVCAGLAYRLKAPVWAVRLLWAATVVFGAGAGFWLYLAAWILVPVAEKLPDDYTARTGDV